MSVIGHDGIKQSCLIIAKRNRETLIGEAVIDHEYGPGGARDEAVYFCGDISVADFAAVCHVPLARVTGIGFAGYPRLEAWMMRMREIPAVRSDRRRLTKAVAKTKGIADEFEGPDRRIHWRDSRLEWPIRHGFIDAVAKEFHAGKMMFPPDAT